MRWKFSTICCSRNTAWTPHTWSAQRTLRKIHSLTADPTFLCVFVRGHLLNLTEPPRHREIGTQPTRWPDRLIGHSSRNGQGAHAPRSPVFLRALGDLRGDHPSGIGSQSCVMWHQRSLSGEAVLQKRLPGRSFQACLSVGDHLPAGLFILSFSQGIQKTGNMKQPPQPRQNLQMRAGIPAENQEE